MMRQWLLAITICLLCLCLPAGLAEGDGSDADGTEDERYLVTFVEATCETPAYRLYEDLADGTIRIVDEGEANGHSWVQESLLRRVCSVCGAVDELTADASLPEVRLLAPLDGIGKKERVTVPVRFVSPEQSFECLASMSIQGHSTLGLEKKNYTMRLYDDEELTKKHSLAFGQWQQEHKYILKAYQEDTSVCRDLTCARLWGRMAAIRSNLYGRLLQCSNYGAVNGFPVTVWLEDEFLGLYTMNLHKDNDLYQMSKRSYEAVMIANDQTMPESLFMAEAAFVEDVSDWEVEVAGLDTVWACDHFNEMIRFVMNSSDEEFRASLGDYVDVDAAIDYLLFIWTMGLEHNAAKDLVMLTYGEHWIPSVYDMQDGIGLACAADAFLPDLRGAMDSATGSLLWDRLLRCFTPELRARYTALRQDVLSEESILGELDALWNSIPEYWRALDLMTYPGREPSSLEDMHAFIQTRLPLLDAALMQ